MDRDWGAPDALAFVRATDFSPVHGGLRRRLRAQVVARVAAARHVVGSAPMCARIAFSAAAAGCRRRDRALDVAGAGAGSPRRPPTGRSRSISCGCSTSRIQSVNAQQQLVAGRPARIWWKRLSAALNGGVPGSWPAASSIAACSSAAVSSVAFAAARPASGTSRNMRASSSSRERDGLGREHHRDRLADVAAHALARRAGDEDPAGAAAADPDQVRGGEQPQALAQRRARDAELRRELLLGADPVARAAGLRAPGSGGSRARSGGSRRRSRGRNAAPGARRRTSGAHPTGAKRQIIS